MSDLIERRAAIDAVEKESQVDGAYGYMDTKSIVDLIMDLPSAQQWIPISERLPEVGRNVLMSVGKGMYTAEGFLKGNGKWAQYRWSANLDNVDAWAEMPEPWKGEENV